MSERVRAVTAAEYAALFPEPHTVFDTVAFATLNAARAERLLFLAGHGMGIILGERNGTWHAPFSAPYSLPAGSGDCDAFLNDILAITGPQLALTLPAPFYGGAEWADALNRAGAINGHEYNYHYPLERFDHFADYALDPVPRNLRRAAKAAFSLVETDDIDTVYTLIADHHRHLGYHMAMTLQQVKETARILKADFFLLLKEGTPAAAAFVEHTAPGIVQLINWGDDPQLRQWRTMNALAHELLRHYAATPGIEIFDLGPASTDGIRNEGLIRYKLSLGAVETLKPTRTPKPLDPGQ